MAARSPSAVRWSLLLAGLRPARLRSADPAKTLTPRRVRQVDALVEAELARTPFARRVDGDHARSQARAREVVEWRGRQGGGHFSNRTYNLRDRISLEAIHGGRDHEAIRKRPAPAR